MKYSLSLAFVLLAACGSKTAPTTTTTTGPTGGGTGAQAAGVTPVEDENGTVYQISQGVPGEPGVVGCADGQREAFVDATAFPTIAGCIGEWTDKMSLRTAATGAACGDDKGPCGAPADACAAGWHLCGSSGAIAEVHAVGAEACEQAGGGRFVAAISHCKTQEGCEYASPADGQYQCFAEGWCSEPVCCGNDCGELGACTSGIWENKTHIPVGTDQGCGAIGSSRARGVLCCKG